MWVVVILFLFSFQAGATDQIDALVAEEHNCTVLPNQTAELRRECKKDVIERLFLYIEMQQLLIARKREEREEIKERELEAMKKKKEADKVSGLNIFAAGWIGVLLCMTALMLISR
jgi:hypothetical protein